MDVGFKGTVVCRECYSAWERLYLELDDCALVVVKIAIVWCGEDGDDCGE
jgi:hypothetical protein